MIENIFRHAKKILPFIGIVILLYLIFTSDIEKITDNFWKIFSNPIFFVIALSLLLPRVLVRNYAWQFILKEQKIQIGFWKSLKIFLIGFFYCSVTPGYVGHVMRIPYLKEATNEPYGKLFVNTIVELVIRSFSNNWIITMGLVFLLAALPGYGNIMFIWIAYIVISLSLLIYLIKRERGEKLLLFLIRLPIPIYKRYRTSFEKFVATFYNDFPRVRILILPFLLGIITWVIGFAQEYMFVLALELPIPFLEFMLLFSIANVVGFLPITFAGLGTREYTATFIFTSLYATVSQEEILLVSLLGFFVVDVFTGLVGFVLSLIDAREKPIKEMPLKY